jgi:hypothetical protein
MLWDQVLNLGIYLVDLVSFAYLVCLVYLVSIVSLAWITILLLHHIPSQHQYINPALGKRVPGVSWTTYDRLTSQVETGIH